MKRLIFKYKNKQTNKNDQLNYILDIMLT